MSKELASYGAKIVATDSSDDAIKDADVIVLATTSEVPVIDGNLVKEGALISGVGSYMPNMHEIDEVSIKRASKIFCDSVEAVLEEAGCIITPLKKGIISEENDLNKELGDVVSGKIPGRESDDEIIIFKIEEAGCIITPLKKGIISEENDLNKELGDVVSGKIPGRESDDEIIIFKSVGIGVQDVVTAQMIYDWKNTWKRIRWWNNNIQERRNRSTGCCNSSDDLR